MILQQNQERAPNTYVAFTISSVASVYYNNCADNVPLENAPNVGSSGSEPEGGEEGDGKNLHSQQSHVNAMRFLALPACSSTRPPWHRERMLQALTLVRGCNETEFAAKKQG